MNRADSSLPFFLYSFKRAARGGLALLAMQTDPETRRCVAGIVLSVVLFVLAAWWITLNPAPAERTVFADVAAPEIVWGGR